MVREILGTGITDIPELQTGRTQSAPGQKSFGEFLTESLEKVNQLQKESEDAVKSIASGAEGPALHEAMVAVEKADVAFKLMMEVRQKILEAYKEITQMQA